jgi:D-alanyl-D-alanine carboxypeptidase (penicillin-binding protein 5/6)
VVVDTEFASSYDFGIGRFLDRAKRDAMTGAKLFVSTFALFLLIGRGGIAAEPPSDDLSVKLAERLAPLISKHEGDVSVAIQNLSGEGTFRHRAEQPMATASLIKLPLMVTAYRQIDTGKLDPDAPIRLREEDKVPGSGILTDHFSAGLRLSLVDAIRLMIRYSDNTATNLVATQTGLEATAETMEQLGLPHTKLHSLVYRRETSRFPERSKRFGLGSTSADEMIQLLEQLHRGEIAGKASCEAMLEHLRACEDSSKLAAGLPAAAALAHKTGAVSSVRTDAGIVYGPGEGQAFAICVLTENNRDRRWTDDNAADRLIASIAKRTYEVFYGADAGPEPVPPSELKLGDHGKLVEDLQRTLNDRLDPSPELSIDGDFGPMTQSAVLRFQRSKGLEASGVVGRETFAALGTLIDRDAPPPAPETVNAQWPEKRPADAIEGAPFVTAKSWVIVDAANGKQLAGFRENQSRPMASTTKVMTARVVATLAENDETVWDQPVTFSQRADETVGSTCGLRAGETLAVRDLLYGLLLPSGNDAAVALAEHFGGQRDRLAKAFPEGNFDAASAYDRFLEAMNLSAERLGLQETHFVNPHGLTEPNHRASASDLAKLALAAMKDAMIRKVVATPQYGCSVEGASGYRRDLAWYNTNRLLKIEGYRGVKTGTTSAAGACLISLGQRDDRGRVIVVLGSASSDARYADTRNLFRWTWQQHTVDQP